ncbi:MAG: hypothetical protein HC789_10975 [Microcoleus sp. CSU_2_2]|nr:hypothetical protein [Microcoleus sp. SU_5_3]NJS10843.1 hypothetical protein [Microcoleus sp. CSU_2_2]
MLQKNQINNSLLSALDLASGRSLVVELGEENEELLSLEGRSIREQNTGF